MTFTVVLNNPASGHPYELTVQASTLEEANVIAKQRWGSYVMYVRHN